MDLCVVFDFDGTLVLSNDVKRDGFFAVIPRSDDARNCMEKVLASPPGDRWAIFKSFADRAGGNAEELTAAYTAWCEDRILTCPERPGASAAIESLVGQGVSVHINSATPEAPLRTIVNRRYRPDAFASVRGGHGKKVANLKAILKEEGRDARSLAMVGDGTDDRDAASAIGCIFVGIGGGTLASADPQADFLEDLTSLPYRLQHARRGIN